MFSLKTVLFITTLACFTSCNNKEKNKEIILLETQEPVSLSKSQILLNETIATHGGELYNTAHYSFVFRNNIYQFKNNGSEYEYTKISKKDNTEVIDKLDNGTFTRTINGESVKLTEKEIATATGAINSVIYFATLPHKLNDKAVNSKYIESTTIKGETYDVIEITFNQDGGGEDHDDEYYYWINANTKKIDYLAYNYRVNKGGVRFRSAYNKRIVDGIRFQDYINYEAPVGTPLKKLPSLFEANKLNELSKIETENIINLNNN
jgi:hypothetical protein